MAPRPTWKGTLKISLVTIPIKVFPATDSTDSLASHQLHGRCLTKMQQKRWCPTCEQEIPYAEIVKGYEVEGGKYVVLSEDELATVKPESTKVINLITFDAASALDSVAIDRSYYLAPNGTDGDAYAYAVLRTSLAGKVGVGKLAVYGREYLVAVRPSGRGLVLQTLHHDAEIRKFDDLADVGTLPAKVKPADVTMAKQVIATLAGPLDLARFTDAYREGLQQVIDAKVKGEQVIEATPAEAPKVATLKDALRQSLHLVRGGKKAPKVPAKVADRGERRRKRA